MNKQEIIDEVYFENPRLNSKSAMRDILDIKTQSQLSCGELDKMLDDLIHKINNPQVGEVFFVRHVRKGEFIVRFDTIDDEWISATIVSGIAKAVMEYNTKHEGDKIALRRSLIYYYPIKDVTNPTYVKKAKGIES